MSNMGQTWGTCYITGVQGTVLPPHSILQRRGGQRWGVDAFKELLKLKHVEKTDFGGSELQGKKQNQKAILLMFSRFLKIFPSDPFSSIDGTWHSA